MSWLLHDSCYNPTIFDTSLQEVFGKTHHIFDVAGPQPELHSKSKFGIITTNIAKKTKSFIFGNFNAADPSSEDHGKLTYLSLFSS